MSNTVDAMAQAIACLDGSRRVGWAKYYDTARDLKDEETERKRLHADLAATRNKLEKATQHLDNARGWLGALIEYASTQTPTRRLVYILHYMAMDAAQINAAFDFTLGEMWHPDPNRRSQAAKVARLAQLAASAAELIAEWDAED